MRNACSTRSTYSAGVSSPTMSVQLRIRVLRLRQLSTRRFYDPLDGREERVIAEQPACMDELPARSHDVAELGLVARRGKMAEATRAVVGQAFQRVRSGGV